MKYHSDMDFGNRKEISTRIFNISNCTRKPNFQNDIKSLSGPDPHNLEVYVHREDPIEKVHFAPRFNIVAQKAASVKYAKTLSKI